MNEQINTGRKEEGEGGMDGGGREEGRKPIKAELNGKKVENYFMLL